MKISIIVPVYKVKKYIEKCIQSLLDQTYTNFEALIINDGSPDQSITIAKKLVGGDPRFIFLEKENGGLSSARNYGLDHMTGDYVYFLDSDDYIDKETLEKCIKAFKKNPSLDIVIFGTNWVTTSGEIIKQTISNIDKYYNKNDILLINGSIEMMAWNKMYRSEIFNNIRFTNGIIYEDSDLIYKLLYNRHLYLLNEYLYYYVQREGSIMSTYDANSTKSLVYLYDSYKSFLNEQQLYDEHMESLNKHYYRLIVFTPLIRLVQTSKNYSEDSKIFMEMLNKEKVSLKQIKKYYSINSKQFWGFFLFKTSPTFFKKLINCISFIKKIKNEILFKC